MKHSEVIKTAFDLLEDDPVVASNLKVRADLMMQIEETIEKRKLTQTQAAELMDVSQPRVSDLMKGKIDKFSIDTLVNMLTALGKEVTFKAA